MRRSGRTLIRIGVRPADRAWIGLAAAVTCYEVAASRRDWELLSEAMDRYRGEGRLRDDFDQAVRLVIDAAIIYLALHLRRRWPARLDPLGLLARLAGR